MDWGILIGAAWCVGLASLVVCIRKGKNGMALAGFILGFGAIGAPLLLVGAIRLAKPNSTWAKQYPPEKLAAARRREAEQIAASRTVSAGPPSTNSAKEVNSAALANLSNAPKRLRK